ncbi:type II toxin-antitoxin system RelE/ParE family toxin [Rhizobium alarense]|uniref:type II toxin-antitoxin system RelE/ParE family toxin n=1 Tax=Rhizobium alarense TaxID=2846851 RepID=UPI0038B55FF4
MRIVYLPSTRADLLWFRRYYEHVFPEGLTRARNRFRAIERLLRDNPNAGRPSGVADIRELPVSKTPFLVIYRVREDRIEILRLWDARRNPDHAPR